MRSFRILSAASLFVLASGIALAADPLQVADPVTPADAVAPVDAVAPASDVASIDALADACELNFTPADADVVSYLDGNSLGPLTGGAIAASFGLRWVFLITAALLLANLIWVYLTVPEYVETPER